MISECQDRLQSAFLKRKSKKVNILIHISMHIICIDDLKVHFQPEDSGENNSATEDNLSGIYIRSMFALTV